jgi:hypothetical protein
MFPSSPPTPLLDLLKNLTNPSNDISHLCQRKVLSQANSWTPVKGDICPWDGRPRLPPRGIEIVYGGAEEVLSPLHDVRGVNTHCPLWHQYRLPSEWNAKGYTYFPWGPPPKGSDVSTRAVRLLCGTMGYNRRVSFKQFWRNFIDLRLVYVGSPWTPSVRRTSSRNRSYAIG